ncbi:toll-like receptor 5 [Acipenser oxyrinchus oxyrinchus]|uniref:Toll-like receptor 5 n=1 Tax=Acipenser oxyrinchus oxyrinchus TaxID=40147 RepID=A0AAD8CNQ3_ACIOX|nr:toll-like receptor 5 [Acipenser oxyrinchus oxyrinchus]
MRRRLLPLPMILWALLGCATPDPSLKRTAVDPATIANHLAQGLTAVPSVSRATAVLLLSFNRIRSVSQASFPEGLGALRRLSLGGQLTRSLQIGGRSFTNAPNLTSLDLGGNGQLVLHREAFAGLGELESLFLDSNGLDEGVLESGLFRSLLSLRSLVLTGNRIRRLSPDSSFRNLPSLRSLDLKLNRISELCGSDSDALPPGLSKLDLSSNRLSYNQWPSSSSSSSSSSSNSSVCPLGSAVNLTLEELDISLNPLNLQGAENFFRAIAGSRIQRLIFRHTVLGRNFGFRNLGDPDSRTFAGLGGSDVRSFDLSRGFIFRLNPGVFSGLPRAESLSLAFHKINRIGKGAFLGLARLRTLNLSHNLLGEIYQEGLESLRASPLQHLDLKSNHIGAVEDEAFSGLRSLRTLDLGDNALSRIPRSRIPGLEHLLLGQNRIGSSYGIQHFSPGLISLDLSSNRLRDLGELGSLMQQLHSLRFLKLSRNGIDRCLANPGALPPLSHTQLLSLDLSRNSLGEAWAAGSCLDAFRQLSLLRVLNLGSNRLSAVPDLQDLSSLRSLDLSGNSLRTLPRSVFRGLGSLEFLSLTDNCLSTLPPSLLPSLPALRGLGLGGNPFVCGCGGAGDGSATRLTRWFVDNNVTSLDLPETVSCASLVDLEEVSIDSLPW